MIGSSGSRDEKIFLQNVFLGFEHIPSNRRLTVDEIGSKFEDPAKQQTALLAVIQAVPPPFDGSIPA